MSEQKTLFKKPVVKIEKPKGKIPHAINGKVFRAKQYKPVDLGEYTDLLGDIQGNTVITAYGPSGSGKSVWVLQFVSWLADKYGKVCYNSHEERHNKSLQERIIKFKANDKIYFAPAWTYEQLKYKTHINKYRVVVIDSAQYMNFTYDQFQDFRDTFKKRNIILIVVSFGTSLGQTDGCKDILHASDIKMHFKNGRLTCVSRYKSETVVRTLFKLGNTSEIFNS
jgi:predicted ATP-dependent serine protease